MKKLTLVALVFVLLCFPHAALAGSPLVGVIRFDVWDSRVTIAPDPKNWGPQMWNYRLPYFTKWDTGSKPVFYGMDQSNMDKEIQLAEAAGISYFAFDYYPSYDIYNPPVTYIDINYGLRKFLASSVNSNVKFSLVMADLGDKTTWATSQVPKIVSYVHNVKYQTVLDGRALVYFFNFNAYWPKVFGSREAAKAALLTLRQQITSATGKNPYFVTMDYPAAPDDVAYYGFDGRSSYLGRAANSVKTGAPYQELALENQALWTNYSRLGHPVIPLVSAGLDPRPRYKSEKWDTMTWFQKATPEEIASNLRSAIDWVRYNPAKSETNSILMYAWNEFMEGGWIVPTLFEGDARLQAISSVINGRGFSLPRIGGIDVNSDNKIDIYDYNLLVGNFGKTGVGDINKDGKVDIFDFNILVGNFGK